MTLRTPLLLAIVLLVGCTPAENGPLVIDWDVTEEAPGEFDQPNFSLALTLSRGSPSRVEIGKYVGMFVDGREILIVQMSGAILTGASWWAGAGDEFAVRRNDAGVVEILHRPVEEEVETGEFEVLKTIGIPPTVTVQTAG